ncbi:MAG: glycosyltransferase, partial [Clostridiaceae bacterium]|nr:glycosyltransferase [Clostridiaceae bacterium]
GEEKENIKNLIAEKNLGNVIKISDFQINPYRYIKRSDVFVCASYAEGYSTAVSEAVALNVPVITTECSGMREIFGENECGIICENSEDGLYNAMKKVLENPDLLKKFSEQEKIRAKDFSLEKRVKAYEDFLESV